MSWGDTGQDGRYGRKALRSKALRDSTLLGGASRRNVPAGSILAEPPFKESTRLKRDGHRAALRARNIAFCYT